jgi:Uncharacterized membrane-anchored protein conserved in bacteria
MKKWIVFPLALLLSFSLHANNGDTLDLDDLKQLLIYDSINKAMSYETGVITLPNGIAQLNVPAGFKFLNQEQSRYVLSDLWGNPPDMDVLGMIFPEDKGPLSDSMYAFVIRYEAIGYVKDSDADDIDYDELLKDMQDSEAEVNKERKKLGYPTVHIVGWAQMPFYDKANKVLHWAKEIEFGGDENHTLNYDVRILGRKGILSLNAVAGMSELPLVKQNIDKVLHIATFTEGNRYADFDSNIDEVAAYGIGGLVAGKVLAKAGFFALIAKFLKPILLGIAGLGALIFRFVKRKKPDEPAYEQSAADQTNG